jgi:hypothetical protein
MLLNDSMETVAPYPGASAPMPTPLPLAIRVTPLVSLMATFAGPSTDPMIAGAEVPVPDSTCSLPPTFTTIGATSLWIYTGAAQGWATLLPPPYMLRSPVVVIWSPPAVASLLMPAPPMVVALPPPLMISVPAVMNWPPGPSL